MTLRKHEEETVLAALRLLQASLAATEGYIPALANYSILPMAEIDALAVRVRDSIESWR